MTRDRKDSATDPPHSPQSQHPPVGLADAGAADPDSAHHWHAARAAPWHHRTVDRGRWWCPISDREPVQSNLAPLPAGASGPL